MRRLIAPAVLASCIAALAFLSACHTLDSMENGIVGSWRIEDVNGGGVIDSSRLEIRFDADGDVSGHAGSNTFTGTYTRDAGAIDIGPLASTRRACGEALMLQAARLLLRRLNDAAPADAGGA